MMKKYKAIIACVLACAMILGGGFALAQAAGEIPSETNPFGKIYYIGATDQNEPFIDVVIPRIAANLEENNTHSINPHFDKLPVANNPENFQGLGSTTYANINGKTVTAEAFYRVRNDSLCDPNAGMGLLIYQCLLYKAAHPEEDVEITFSTYRTSASAAVCVLPESKYYGYMRSLFTTNYDEHGFVRISYLMAEAARMGIKVTLLNQLGSYAVPQYDPSTQTTKDRSTVKFTTYFNRAKDTKCYNKYAPGKKVSDFLDCIVVGWAVSDQTTDMQHVKSCTVSHYLATDGSEHRSGVFFTTSNLDENDYLGRNGNSWSQTGVILSDHDDIYRVTLNYTRLMQQYAHQEGIQEMRKIIIDRNKEQMELILTGREKEIPADEQIIYLGSESDKVFQLWFTPLPNGVDTWDVKNNPICYHLSKMGQSEDYVELAWNEYGYETTSYLSVATAKMIEKAFCENPNPQNKLSIKVNDINLDKVKKLDVGSEIGYRSIKNGKYMHAKDFLISYVDKGDRHNVSILTSCNYVKVGFHYRTNSILVIDETELTGGNFYEIIGPKYSGGMIKAK